MMDAEHMAKMQEMKSMMQNMLSVMGEMMGEETGESEAPTGSIDKQISGMKMRKEGM